MRVLRCVKAPYLGGKSQRRIDMKTFTQLARMSVSDLEKLREELIAQYNNAIKNGEKFDTAYVLTVNTVLSNKHLGLL